MNVYRVENEVTKRGPYAGTPGTMLSGWEEPNKPMPFNDGLEEPMRAEEYRFGFESVDKVKDWFSPEEMRLLESKGFHLAAYEVPNDAVQLGGHQLIFDHEHAEIITTIDLTSESL